MAGSAATGASVGMAVGGPWGAAIGAGLGFAADALTPAKTTTTLNASGKSSKQRIFDQAGIDKLIYDVMSSDRGLASLASGENLSGGFNSSTKTLQTQDFLTKLIGELAVAGAPEVTTEDKQSTQTQKKKSSVICTELALQGYLCPELYEAGGPASKQIPFIAWVGYHSWAVHVVARMKKSPRLCAALAPIVISRYRYLTNAPGANILGRITVYVGHPACYLIGTVINWSGGYARANEFA